MGRKGLVFTLEGKIEEVGAWALGLPSQLGSNLLSDPRQVPCFAFCALWKPPIKSVCERLFFP